MYYTVDADRKDVPDEQPVYVELIIRPNNHAEKKITLLRNGGWEGGLSGTFTTPVAENLPENNLFLVLKNDRNNTNDLMASVSADLDDTNDDNLMLSIRDARGKTTNVPIRSVEKGVSTLSFYRQSEHQAI